MHVFEGDLRLATESHPSPFGNQDGNRKSPINGHLNGYIVYIMLY